mmetsp:Transcript_1222/g.2122  ORF Transcript_1222/g.2122 Transcript_1222/m.2122 type:complete len:594 (+) Transcript_1222:781-2562(+)|eukprot:CAMPEP_0171492322 /NCGR_PEP_ID=MMETSP0958-20121227/4345_1 /TAXON_ID=87120 /ORGANISM="Aurantiochytrium limacinum, Strain ATCCMYA-1381" /LENGTH=593 /DNA_ID=CAMNT_0012025827 /DNA_START=1595 /DNA_END=3376 /DNA_ORIENTATION=-
MSGHDDRKDSQPPRFTQAELTNFLGSTGQFGHHNSPALGNFVAPSNIEAFAKALQEQQQHNAFAYSSSQQTSSYPHHSAQDHMQSSGAAAAAAAAAAHAALRPGEFQHSSSSAARNSISSLQTSRYPQYFYSEPRIEDQAVAGAYPPPNYVGAGGPGDSRSSSTGASGQSSLHNPYAHTQAPHHHHQQQRHTQSQTPTHLQNHTSSHQQQNAHPSHHQSTLNIAQYQMGHVPFGGYSTGNPPGGPAPPAGVTSHSQTSRHINNSNPMQHVFDNNLAPSLLGKRKGRDDFAEGSLPGHTAEISPLISTSSAGDPASSLGSGSGEGDPPDAPPAHERIRGRNYMVKGCVKRWDGKRFARCCDAPNCNKLAQGTTNYCKNHGGGSRCKVQGCTRAARGGSDKCAAHGGGKRCEHPGCEHAAIGRNLCRRHGGGKVCNVSGCQNNARGKSHYCAMHKSRAKMALSNSATQAVPHGATETRTVPPLLSVSLSPSLQSQGPSSQFAGPMPPFHSFEGRNIPQSQQNVIHGLAAAAAATSSSSASAGGHHPSFVGQQHHFQHQSLYGSHGLHLPRSSSAFIQQNPGPQRSSSSGSSSPYT